MKYHWTCFQPLNWRSWLLWGYQPSPVARCRWFFRLGPLTLTRSTLPEEREEKFL